MFNLNYQIMPGNKNYSLRIMVLDRMLRKKNGATMQEIFTSVNKFLEESGLKPLRTYDTIRNDFMETRNRHHINIIRFKEPKDRRIWRYRYENESFSVFKYPLTPEQVWDIKGALDLLRTFKGMPQYKWINGLCAHFDVASDPRGCEVVHFQDTCVDIGKNFFSPLFHAILNKQPLTITYQRFGHDERKHIVFPYYLKQFRCRWYLVAKNIRHLDSMGAYSLDRIISFEENEDVTYIPTDMTIDEYYKDVYGLTRHEGDEPITILFHVDKRDLPYLNTNPIHDSQETVEEDETGATLSIHVIPNHELMMHFLAYGDSVVVTTDCSLRDDIVAQIKKMLRKYEKYDSPK